MSLWDAFTGRIYAWNSATNELVREFSARAKAPATTAPVGHFRKWYFWFFGMMQVQLLQAFEDKNPIEKFYWGRIKAYNKETFRTLQAVFLCHHLHVIRDQLGDSVTEMLDDAAGLLDMSQTRLRDLFKSYDEKHEGVHIQLHTWRLICQTIGANDTENILVMTLWLERILFASQHAHQEHPLVKV